MSKWFKGLRLKLLILSVIPLLGLSGLAGYSMFQMNKLGNMLGESYTLMIPTVESLQRILAGRNGMNYYMWQAMYYIDRPSQRLEVIKKGRNSYKDMTEAISFYESTEFSEEEQKNWDVFKKNKERFYALSEKIISDLEKNDKAIDQEVMSQLDGGEWHVLVTDLRKATEKNIVMYRDLTVKNNEIQEDLRTEARNVSLTLAALICLGVLSFGLVIAQRLSGAVEGALIPSMKWAHS